MASEIRVNKINSRTGVGTITLSPTGVDFTGIATVATLKATTGIVTTLTATTGIVTTLTVDTARTTTGIVTTLTADTSRITTGIVTTLTADTAKVGAAVTISESGMEVTGVTTVTSSINIGSATTISSSSLEVNGVQYPTAGALSNRNLVINGDMNVAQRGTSFTVTDAYTLDRYKFKENTAGAATVTQSSTAPDGFSYSLKVDVTTADTSISSTDHGILMHSVEGYNFAQADFGSSAAKKVTLSFWVRSNKTGTYGVAFQNSAQNRSRVKEYTISSADTWEHKTITLDEDTAGTWLTTSGIGVKLTWGLMGGSTYATSDVSNWKTTNVFLTSNQVNLFDSTSNEWYLTGVQLEVGTRATPFEHRSYGDELQKCKRYYQETDVGYGVIGHNRASTVLVYRQTLPVEMRATPSISAPSGFDGGDWARQDGANLSSISHNSYSGISSKSFGVLVTCSGASSGESCFQHGSAQANAECNAEL